MNTVTRSPLLRSILLVVTLAAVPSAVSAQAGLPASGDDAAARLNASPRHTEWVTIDSRGDTLDAFVVYPERSDNAPVVVVIHEIYGLSEWARAVADELAAEGFIAIAPDMLSGKGPNGTGSTTLDNQGAVSLMRSLQPAEVTRRINMAVEYATTLPAATQRFGIIGFCWGGSTSFQFATARENLGAAVVYYGTSPDSQALRRGGGNGSPRQALRSQHLRRRRARLPARPGGAGRRQHAGLAASVAGDAGVLEGAARGALAIACPAFLSGSRRARGG